jgi:hypothetical protein
MLRLARKLVGAVIPDPILRALQPAAFDERLLGWTTAAMLKERYNVPVIDLTLEELLQELPKERKPRQHV